MAMQSGCVGFVDCKLSTSFVYHYISALASYNLIFVSLVTCSPSHSPILINFPQNSHNLPPGITPRNRAESRYTGTRLKIVLTVQVQESGFEKEEE
ncbi:hypothetical protein M422DRAFT_31158 [Sphaerobolus stellatus SS14]|uniref:Uncharacterized protein n=1 Tax=Sphaerobolus stellatus (strain SS14) TaxID=990650 RepID=A0A0C9VWV2_SPHS4|nr:hypothetical protein M422DRAFT_31158 [Sphaerobolus stellatus SS14]